MEKNYLLVSNNPQAQARYADAPYIAVDFLAEGSFLDVLLRTRDLIQKGWHLLTHPMASNLKPNQSPYKTILVARKLSVQSFAEDELMIERSLEAFHKLTKGMCPPQWSERAQHDFATVDLAVVESALHQPLLQQLMMAQ